MRALPASRGLACILWLICSLATSAFAAQLTLSWIDNANDELGSRIERRLNPGSSYSEVATVGANVTQYTDTTIAAGQAYCYRVQAYNSAGTSGYSNEACATAATAPPPADTTPPVRSNGAPTAVLPAGTTQVTLGLSTNENATCKWATSPNTGYGSMPNTFPTTGGLAHSALRTGLTNGSAYTYYVRCQDAANNANSNDYSIAFSVAQPGAASLLQFSLANYSVSETGSTATVTVTRTLSTAVEAQVHYETSDGTARAGVDYTPAEGDLVFKVGETTKTFTVAVIDNTIVDGPRTLLLRLSDPRDADLGGQNTAVLTIQDDDGGGIVEVLRERILVPGQLGLCQHHRDPKRREGPRIREVSDRNRRYCGARNGLRPDQPSRGPRFLPNETTKTFTLRVKANSVVNSSKTVQLLLSDPAGGAALGTPASATLTITNDDTGGGIRFGASSYSVAENVGTAHVTVTRSGGAASGVTVEVKAVDGTAKVDSRLRCAVTERADVRRRRDEQDRGRPDHRQCARRHRPEPDVEAPEPRWRRHAQLAEHGDAQHHKGRHPIQPDRLHGQRGARVRDDHGQPRRECQRRHGPGSNPGRFRRRPRRLHGHQSGPDVDASRAVRSPRPSPWPSRTTQPSL